MKLLVALAVLAAEVQACDYPAVEKQSWSVGKERLVLCSSPDSELVVVSIGRAGKRMIYEASIDHEADFAAAPPKFTITELTWRSESEPRVPLVRHDLTLTSEGVTQKLFFVFRGLPFSEERFRRYIEEFLAAPDEALLYRMRTEGVSRPKRALEMLAPLEPDGHVGEELQTIRYELELARDLPHSK